MKILLTNHHLLNLTGTEVYTYTLAKFLKKYGHEVTVYSQYLGNIKKDFEALDIHITNELTLISNQTFDIAHVHHNINAIEIRHYFPYLPIVLQIHGSIHFLEQLPICDINISHYLTITDAIKNKLTKEKIDPKNITVSRNLIDTNLFKSTHVINKSAQKAIVISSYLPIEQEIIIRQACHQLNIDCQFFGGRFKQISQLDIAKQINQSDIVFSLGRGAMEAMLCKRVPIIYDYQNGDGLVTPQNFAKIAFENFSGRAFAKYFNIEQLIDEIKKYRQKYGGQLYPLAFDYFDADINVQKLITIYSRIIKSKPIIKISPQSKDFCDFFVKAITETRNFSRLEKTQYFLNKQPYLFFHQIKQWFKP